MTPRLLCLAVPPVATAGTAGAGVAAPPTLEDGPSPATAAAPVQRRFGVRT